VGNISVGGTGKTPTTVYLARELCTMGFRPVILSRGYKGTLEKDGGLVSDGIELKLGPEQSGDEPYLMANLLPHIPVIINADRYAGGCLAVKRFNPDVIILDDGYQHIQLHRDLNLLLLDAGAPLGNGYLLPRGHLREPPGAISRADALVYTRSIHPLGMKQGCHPLESGKRPVFNCRHKSVLRFRVVKGDDCHCLRFQTQPNPDEITWAASPVFVFSGLARNASLRESALQMGINIVGYKGFDDHHWYTMAELEAVNRKAVASGSRYLVTTDKDYVRLPKDWRFGLDLIVLGVEIDFEGDSDRWRQFLLNQLLARFNEIQ